jgi:hypothetical protein
MCSLCRDFSCHLRLKKEEKIVQCCLATVEALWVKSVRYLVVDYNCTLIPVTVSYSILIEGRTEGSSNYAGTPPKNLRSSLLLRFAMYSFAWRLYSLLALNVL